jgi:hypothetical protein
LLWQGSSLDRLPSGQRRPGFNAIGSHPQALPAVYGVWGTDTVQRCQPVYLEAMLPGNRVQRVTACAFGSDPVVRDDTGALITCEEHPDSAGSSITPRQMNVVIRFIS